MANWCTLKMLVYMSFHIHGVHLFTVIIAIEPRERPQQKLPTHTSHPRSRGSQLVVRIINIIISSSMNIIVIIITMIIVVIVITTLQQQQQQSNTSPESAP